MTGDDQPIVTAITDLMLKDYFNPTLIALRSSFCGGLTCPTSSAGFQIFIKPDKSIKQGSIDICYGEPEIGETFAPASSAKDSSQYIKKLNLSSSYDTPSTFPPLLVTAVRYKSSVPACRLNNSSYVIGIINLNDYQKLVSKKDRSTANASLLFATSAQ